MKTKTQAKLENILLPIAKRLDVNPNLLTLLSIASILASAYYILALDLVTASVLFAIGALLDGLDGLVARTHRRGTKFGVLFDQTADRINDGVIVIAVAVAGYIEPFIGLAALFFVFLASYISAVLDSLSGKRIGDIISFRPVRSIVLFAGLLSGEIVVAIWLVLFIGIWATLYRLFKAKWVLS